MKRAIIVLILLCPIFPFILTGQDKKQTDDLTELLNSLKSDGEIIDKYKEKEPDKKPPQEARSPVEIIEEVSRRMDNIVKELDNTPHEHEKIIDNQEEVVKLLDSLLERAVASMGSSSQSSKSQSNSSALAQIKLSDNQGTGGNKTGGSGNNKNSTEPNKEAGSTDGQKWGALPDKVREEIMQLLQEDIPVLYRELLRLYYKNLDKE